LRRFLWAKLQIESICEAKIESIVRALLKEMPRGLPAAYQRMEVAVSQQEKTAVQLAHQVLQVLAFALRALTFQELRIALSLGHGSRTLDPDLFKKDLILEVCFNFLILEPASGELCFVHFSAQEYIKSRCCSEKFNASLAATCLRYIREHPCPYILILI
jgi:hypothetical protein